MGTSALKTASGVAATCGLTTCRTLGKAIFLWVATCLWVAVVLTAVWPFVVASVLIWGSDEMIRDIPFNAVCWAFNVGGLLFIARAGRANHG